MVHTLTPIVTIKREYVVSSRLGGWFNAWLEQWPNYVNNRLTTNPWTSAAMSYDAAGNLTNDGYQTYTYDATGQQVSASLTGLTQSYDGDGLRVKKVESTVTTYYLRSSVLGGHVVAEITGGNGQEDMCIWVSVTGVTMRRSLAQKFREGVATEGHPYKNATGIIGTLERFVGAALCGRPCVDHFLCKAIRRSKLVTSGSANEEPARDQQ